jgi:hypothetical protein
VTVGRQITLTFLRDNGLSKRSFKSFDDIVDPAARLGTSSPINPRRIMSIGMRGWAYGS